MATSVIWSPLPGYETKFEVSTDGSIRRLSQRLGPKPKLNSYESVRRLLSDLDEPKSTAEIYSLIEERFVGSSLKLPQSATLYRWLTDWVKDGELFCYMDGVRCMYGPVVLQEIKSISQTRDLLAQVEPEEPLAAEEIELQGLGEGGENAAPQLTAVLDQLDPKLLAGAHNVIVIMNYNTFT